MLMIKIMNTATIAKLANAGRQPSKGTVSVVRAPCPARVHVQRPSKADEIGSLHFAR